MRLTLYKTILDDDTHFYTNDRREICQFLNNRNRYNDGYKPYTTNRINGVLYNNSTKRDGFVDIQKFYVNEYFKEYTDKYINNLLKKKNYTENSLNRVKNQYVAFINSIEINMRNNGAGDDAVAERLRQTTLM